ncbi:MAG: PEP/pyruvate-binding domain-containing protein [Micropruina sp.]|uniref:PEP/pyruvate-binding domain-containing protein n=1 Tax=Micropruina sp. TaxID=2737536 RepID=UPI0039E299DB
MYGFLPRLRAPLVTPEAPAASRGARAATVVSASRLLAPTGPVSPEAPAIGLSHLRLDSAELFDAISQPAADLVANGRLTKVFVDQRDPAHPQVAFVNSNFVRNGSIPDAAKYHYFFGREVFGVPEGLDEFNRITYFTPGPKRYIAGVVHSYALAGRPPVLGIQFYPQDVVAEEDLRDAVLVVAAQIALPGMTLAFVQTGTQQTTARVASDLIAGGIDVLTLDDILGSVTYIPLNQGEAWGHLRIFPTDPDDLRPTDIVVLDQLPLDLSVVAGVLTKAVQDTNSHVNLKSKERNTPNAVLRDAGPEHPRLAPFADQPVHYVVRADDYLIEPTTDEVIAEKLAERMNRPLVPLGWEPETTLRSYDEMGEVGAEETLAFARKYGSKAANLGFLRHPEVLGRADQPGTPSAVVGYDLTPDGFAVPFQFYADFVAHPPNAALRAAIDELVTKERAGDLAPRDLKELVTKVQDAFLAAEFPPGQLDAVRARVDALGVKKLKVRSSANAEDIPGFDGAGLYDSFSVKTKVADQPCQTCTIVEEADDDGGETKRKVDPRSLGCAIKGCYASLWNKRAVDERAFARIDQTTVAMGLAVVPAYDNESDVAANAVVVTRVLNTDAVYGYSLSVQQGNNLVTNPDPSTHSELTIAAFISDDEPISLTVTRFAKPKADEPQLTAPVLTNAQMIALVNIVRTVERAYCRANPDYYPGSCDFVTADNEKPRSLDLEIKVLADGRFVVKQVREFGGR